ncbi:MAG: PD40 domain-containing protein [Spirochaetales bacterium]|nr:PD40 domain-containing protein [Spirochaetales bacterium]
MKPDLSVLFSPYTDPESGITNYLLNKRVAPVQQGFYFVNTSFSADNRFLWFYCAFPPAGHIDWGRTLGVIDFKEQTVNHFPETAFGACSPLVDKDGTVYWATQRVICRRGPLPDDTVEIIGELPEEYFGERAIKCVSTHLTFSADKKELFLDCHAGNLFFVGTIAVATKEFRLWKTFDRFYNHGQMHPSDNDLVLVAQDHFHDVCTGVKTVYEDRLWLLQRSGDFRPIFPSPTKVTHEFWDSNGKYIYAINNHDQFGGPGIVRITPDPLAVEIVWKGYHWHAKDFNHGQYFVCDRTLKGFFRGCPSSVHFLNCVTQKEVTMISHNPEFHTTGSMYHVDPHPHFSPDGSLIAFTTTVNGRADLAVAFTKDCIAATT